MSGVLRLLPAGPWAVLVEVSTTAEAMALYAEARAAGPRTIGQVRDLVPAARTVLFDGVADPARLRRWLAGVRPAGLGPTGLGPAGLGPAGGRPVVEVPTVYDGADLDDVARRWSMTRAEAVATHAAADYTVAFCGFAPGFAYCTGLPGPLAVPRLRTPRSRVPAGSVGLADAFTGVYPSASPGGWRLLGRTALPLWDADADPPARLAPGTRVRFVAVGATER